MHDVPERPPTGHGPRFMGELDTRVRFDLEQALVDHIHYTCCTTLARSTSFDVYRALALSIRDRLVHQWLATQQLYHERNAKQVYYLSSEFLVGRSLGLCLYNLGLFREAKDCLARLGHDLNVILGEEDDPGLGNGGLGRLAACFMDSLATLALPATGYGMRYDYGIFEQRIEGGEQVEYPDAWLQMGTPWEIPRYDKTQTVRLYGHVVEERDAQGNLRPRWTGGQVVLGVPHDSFIVGHQTANVHTLRLWAARAPRELDLQRFNDGDYWRAVAEKVDIENISRVLYPADHTPEGKALRLKGQYFFVACSLADILGSFKARNQSLTELASHAAIQLNDTHPAIGVAELMRLLVDEEELAWEDAWEITRASFGYTNHTLLPEALEMWPVTLFEHTLPRHLAIIYEINHRFLAQVAKRFPNDPERLGRMSIIAEHPHKQVRMAHLAVVGSHSVNGVAKLHSELIKRSLLPDFYAMYPERFNNKTNGITPRRWLLYANPRLADLIGELLEPRLASVELERLAGLRDYADDSQIQQRVLQIKHANKQDLAQELRALTGVQLDPNSMFVVHVKRIHEYKRQLLVCLGIIANYLALRDNPQLPMVPRSYIFAGKAAPSYTTAKQHIRLLNDVAEIVNHDPRVQGRLKVVFAPNYSVTLAQALIPAADISVQVSLAGKEASGTGNMKLALNGALTLGTLDGANVEIREAVGPENFVTFGMTVDEVHALQARGYDPSTSIARSPTLQRVVAALEQGLFCPDEPTRHKAIANNLRRHDPFMNCADFDAYLAAEDRAAQIFADPQCYARKSLLNIAGAGAFSSDATIAAYASDIWELSPVPLQSMKQ